MSENKKITIEELAAIKYPLEVGYGVYDRNCEIENLREAYVEGYKLAQEPEHFFNDDRVKTLEKSIEYLLKREEQDKKLYSEEEVLGFGKFCLNKVADFLNGKSDEEDGKEYSIEELFEQFKKK
jgi:hypothetical protein